MIVVVAGIRLTIGSTSLRFSQKAFPCAPQDRHFFLRERPFHGVHVTTLALRRLFKRCFRCGSLDWTTIIVTHATKSRAEGVSAKRTKEELAPVGASQAESAFRRRLSVRTHAGFRGPVRRLDTTFFCLYGCQANYHVPLPLRISTFCPRLIDLFLSPVTPIA